MNVKEFLNTLMPILETFSNNCEGGQLPEQGAEWEESWTPLVEALRTNPEEVLEEGRRALEGQLLWYFSRVGVDVRKVTLGEWLDLNQRVQEALRELLATNQVFLVTKAEPTRTPRSFGTGEVVSVHKTEDEAREWAQRRLQMDNPPGSPRLSFLSGGLLVISPPYAYHVSRHVMGG